MPVKNIADRVWKRQWKLTNKVGQLGRQGVRGKAERNEKRLLNTAKVKKQKI